MTQSSGSSTYTLSYTYDMLSRLKSAQLTEGATTHYSYTNMIYDKAGNLTDFDYDDGGGSVSITNSFTGDLLTARDSNTVNWDENGRQTSQLSSSPNDYFLEYNWDGRLRKAQAGVATKYITAKYTPGGVRITKKREFGDAEDYDHKYIVDISGKLPKILLILDASTEDTLKTFIHANNQVIAQHDGDTSDNLYFYTHDRLGSVRQLFDPADLSVENNYVYDAWGLIVDGETTENIWNPYLFAGYLWDSEISMYYCNARMYDPLLGRFTSRDPARGKFREPITLHKYLYCMNDPINHTDPSGEFSYIGLGASIAIGALQGALEWQQGGSPYDVLTGAVAGGVGGLTGAWFSGAGLMAKVMGGALASVSTVGTEHLLEWDPERLFADMLGAGIMGGALGGMGELLGECFAGVDIGNQWMSTNAREFLEALSQNKELYDELVGVTGSAVWDALLETYKAFE